MTEQIKANTDEILQLLCTIAQDCITPEGGIDRDSLILSVREQFIIQQAD